MFCTEQFLGVLLVKYPLVFMCSTEERIKTRRKKNPGQNTRISEQILFNRGKKAKEKAASESPKEKETGMQEASH